MLFFVGLTLSIVELKFHLWIFIILFLCLTPINLLLIQLLLATLIKRKDRFSQSRLQLTVPYRKSCDRSPPAPLSPSRCASSPWKLQFRQIVCSPLVSMTYQHLENQHTSQNCSNCGKVVKKSLSVRTHVCTHCGHTQDRDWNAARNILEIALRTVGHTGTLIA
jgi:ribosomal protein L37E